MTIAMKHNWQLQGQGDAYRHAPTSVKVDMRAYIITKSAANVSKAVTSSTVAYLLPEQFYAIYSSLWRVLAATTFHTKWFYESKYRELC